MAQARSHRTLNSEHRNGKATAQQLKKNHIQWLNGSASTKGEKNLIYQIIIGCRERRAFLSILPLHTMLETIFFSTRTFFCWTVQIDMDRRYLWRINLVFLVINVVLRMKRAKNYLMCCDRAKKCALAYAKKMAINVFISSFHREPQLKCNIFFCPAFQHWTITKTLCNYFVWRGRRVCDSAA